MKKIINKVRKTLGTQAHKKPVQLPPTFKAVSFSFDDAPASAFSHGGRILERNHLRATYYISMSFLEPIINDYFDIKTLTNCLENGHELACHTHGHFHFYDKKQKDAQLDIEKNLNEFRKHFPNESFKNFSFPFGEQTSAARSIVNNRFHSARSIDHGINQGKFDLNNLKSIRLYEKLIPLDEQIEVINTLVKLGGWLIFYTHDIDENYSKYGCSPQYFEAVVTYCLDAGIDILTVEDAFSKLMGSSKH